MKARIANFYGWTDEQIMSCDYETIVEYYEAITVVDAQNRLVDLSVSDYASATKETRKKLHRQITRLASPVHLREEIDFDEFQRTVSGRR